jgi:nicotinamidase-related amidase
MNDWQEATALIVIDVQKGFDAAAHWGERNNPDCEDNIAKLLAAWRSEGWPVVFVRHDSASPASPLRAGSEGNAFKDVVSGEPDLLVTKSVHSAFRGDPDLHAWLQEQGITTVAICGIQTNMCCETTARAASDLGYQVLFVMDATHTFDIEAPNHQIYRAREIARYTGLNLGNGFAQVVQTRELLD